MKKGCSETGRSGQSSWARSAYLAATVIGVVSAAAGCDDAGKDSPLRTTASAGLTATGDVCMQTLWTGDGNNQGLNCTSNDVRIAEVAPDDICVIDPQTDQCKTGEDRNKCDEGSTFTFEATFTVELTAQTRYDVGLYFDTGGDPGNDGARGGSCTLNTIDDSNSANFINLDSSPDACGDINDPNNPQLVTLRVTTLCLAGNEEGEVALPNCTSWRQPGSNQVCTTAEDAFPGSPSKCNCDDDFTIPIIVEQPQVTITKQAVAACVYFDVSIHNPTSLRTLTFTSLADSLYGNLLLPAGTDAGQNPSLCANDCNLADDDTLGPGETFSCRFGGLVTGRDAVQDNTVTAAFTDEQNQTGTGAASWSFVVDFDPNVVNP
jgi:hypothetical protein